MGQPLMSFLSKWILLAFAGLICTSTTAHAKREWWAASETQVQNAPCKTQRAPSVRAMKSWLEQESAREDYSVSKIVYGVEFIREKKYYVQLFHDLNVLTWGDSQLPTYQTSCHDFYCALKDIFKSEKLGVQIAYLLARYGINANPNVKSTSSITVHWDRHIIPWNTNELDLILTAMADLPQTRTILEYGQQLKRVNSSGNDKSTVANALIYVFNPWLKHTYYMKQYVLFHEMGHNFDYFLKLKENGWRSLFHQANSTSISEYGQTNASEDVAESIVGYRYNGPEMKRAAPKRYEVLKDKIFDGVEYLSRATCIQPSRSQLYFKEGLDLFNQNAAIISTELNGQESARVVALKLIKECGEGFLTQNIEGGEFAYRRCINQNTRRLIYEYLTETRRLKLDKNDVINQTMYNNVRVPSIFALRAIVNFKVFLRAMAADLVASRLTSLWGLSTHIFMQASEMKSFCKTIDFWSVYQDSPYAKNLPIRFANSNSGVTMDVLGERICQKVYANRDGLRTPASRADVIWLTDEVLE